MNTEKILKQLHTIKPDPDYSRRSRLLITGEQAPVSFPVFTVSSLVTNILKSGSAIALSAALLLMLVGSFSLWKFFVPQGTSLIDPAGLRAEAQAIDIQIELNNLTYRESDLSNATSTATMAHTAKGVSLDITKEARAEAEELGLVVPSSTPTLTVDEALDELSR